MKSYQTKSASLGKIFLIIVFLLSISAVIVSAQEQICDDGIDNDGDGLIDKLIEKEICSEVDGTGFLNEYDIREIGVDYAGLFDIASLYNDIATGNKVCELAGYNQRIMSWGNSYKTPENNFIISWDENLGKFVVNSAKGRNNKLIALKCADECFLPPACSDGIDNDNDGLIDMDDSGCYSEKDDSEKKHDPDCEDEEICNGIDDNHDGEIDENNGDCSDDQVCTEGKCVNIVCKKNSDCGKDVFFGDSFCANNNVNRNFITYTCDFPGTAVSFCSDKTTIKELEQCGNNQVCENGKCVDEFDECFDNDNDSYDTCNSDNPNDDGKIKDCNDNNPNVHPDAIELCNEIDDNCNGRVDEGCGGDSIPPAVFLISPVDGSVFIGSPYDIEFLFNIVEENDIQMCGVDVSGTEYIISKDILKDETNSKLINLGIGNYTAFVFCLDDSNNRGESQIINIELKEEGDCSNDNSAPGKITNLKVDKKSDDYIRWEWDNPGDSDFSKNIIFIDNKKVAETSNNYYKAVDLDEDTSYKITVHTKDICGNINNIDVSDTERTDEDDDSHRGGVVVRDIFPEDIIFPDVSLITKAVDKTKDDVQVFIKSKDEVLIDKYGNWLFWILVLIFIVLFILLIILIVRSLAG